ncbi:MAG: A/G-specific adenine glycosylase [Candidatus Omnitrophica bacterium]|nr:A/G-specific adenine glycosylase [Candidatus Omnitrophota bacterium]
MPQTSTTSQAAAARLVRPFQRTLLRWYGRHQRPLPWRKTRDPYKILVSEIMLQQTQVDRVIPKYHEFLRRYPTVHELARARVRELRNVWYPLGYNVRPLRLRTIARRVIRQHGGKIPDSYDGLIAMDGIGRYTAGAVLSFAFNRDAATLDTNVARLLQRYFGASTNRRLWELAQRVIPRGKGYEINQAMMDFGAAVCTARRPQCSTCVLRRSCRSYPYAQPPAASRARRRRRD